MTIYQIILIISMLAGVGLMGYALFISIKQADDEDITDAEELGYITAASAKEAATTTAEFQDISNHIFEELEAKHNELLELYKLVEKKKKELEELSSVKAAQPEYRKAYEELPSASSQGGKTANFAVSTANIRKVRKLQHDGLSTDEIAKELGIGHNEVKLMLDLSKIR